MQENKSESDFTVINAMENGIPLDYKDLNVLIRKAIKNDQRNLIINDVYCQRFIGDALFCDSSNMINIEINGVPGNDLGIFLDGPKIVVNGNTQDQVGNTMSNGTIIVKGDCRDVTGLSMRGGKIFVKGSVGYRVGIHMKAYQNKVPIIVIGGIAKEFFGEYMAGGILVLLGLEIKDGKITKNEKIVSPNVGAGIHGGIIYIRGDIPDSYLGIGTVKNSLKEEDHKKLKPIIDEFSRYFDVDSDDIWNESFKKIYPGSHRPFAAYYTARPI
ncbi:MAG: hypothetical protein ACTSYF_17765 [Promethearchaeota archaeon]